jgi:hypothetical protein
MQTKVENQRFDARNFIYGAFSKDTLDKYPTKMKTFEILKEIKKIDKSKDNILLKTGTSIDDPWPYLQDFEIDMKIIESVKKFDFTPLFISNPTQIEKGIDEAFKVSKSNLYRKDRLGDNLNPSDLNFDVEVYKEKIDEFLLHKVKRLRDDKNFPISTLPKNIQNLIHTYGDVCANVNNKTFENYIYYRKFLNYTSSRGAENLDVMDEN